jgi:hypothetical protein
LFLSGQQQHAPNGVNESRGNNNIPGVVFKPSIQLAARTDQETGPSRAAMEEIDRDPEYVYKRPALPASRPSNNFFFFCKFYFVIHDQKERDI